MLLSIFFLGVFVGFAVKRKIFGLIICSIISFSDQTVKIFVPARHFDKGDIPFDIIGFCSGLAIAWVSKFAIGKLREIEDSR